LPSTYFPSEISSYYGIHKEIFLWLPVYLSAHRGKLSGNKSTAQTLTAQVEEIRGEFQAAFDAYACQPAKLTKAYFSKATTLLVMRL
jgi:hypothetical protein